MITGAVLSASLNFLGTVVLLHSTRGIGFDAAEGLVRLSAGRCVIYTEHNGVDLNFNFYFASSPERKQNAGNTIYHFQKDGTIQLHNSICTIFPITLLDPALATSPTYGSPNLYFRFLAELFQVRPVGGGIYLSSPFYVVFPSNTSTYLYIETDHTIRGDPISILSGMEETILRATGKTYEIVKLFRYHGNRFPVRVP